MRELDVKRRSFLAAAVAAGGAGLFGCWARQSSSSQGLRMGVGEQNKQTLLEFVRVVWEGRDLAALPRFWTPDCVNHAAPPAEQVGLQALRAYHEGFFTGFLPAFSNAKIQYVQQVAEADRVVTQMIFSGEHTGPLFGKPATHKVVSLASIRIDRFEAGKIAEHWSVADVAGLMQQIETSS